jgi:hypothetical protein
MSLLWEDNFADGAFDALTDPTPYSYLPGGTPPTYAGAHPDAAYEGDYGYRLVRPGGGVNQLVAAVAPQTTFWTRQAYRLAWFNTEPDKYEHLLRVRANADGFSACNLYQRPVDATHVDCDISGADDGAGWAQIANKPRFTAGEWYIVETGYGVASGPGAGDGWVRFFVDGIEYFHKADIDNGGSVPTGIDEARLIDASYSGQFSSFEKHHDIFAMNSARIFPLSYPLTLGGAALPLIVGGGYGSTAPDPTSGFRRVTGITWTGQSDLSLEFSYNGTSWHTLVMTGNAFVPTSPVIARPGTRWRVPLSDDLSLGSINIATQRTGRRDGLRRL